MKRLLERLSYANVVSSIALVLALGAGTAVATSQLAPRSVGERQLRPGAVTPDKIRKNAITAPKIKAEAVKSGKIGGGAVIAAKLANGAVSFEKLANGSVGTEKLATDAVTGEKINESTLGPVPSANTANSASFAEAANPAAFAKVDKAGNLDVANSKGIAAVKQAETGVYCVTVAGASPRGAIVTPLFDGISTVSAFARIGSMVCPSPQIEVQIWNGGLKAELPFFLVAYR
jgi:hypothetical protein